MIKIICFLKNNMAAAPFSSYRFSSSDHFTKKKQLLIKGKEPECQQYAAVSPPFIPARLSINFFSARPHA